MNRIIDRPESQFIRVADHLAALHAAAGHPDRKAVWVVISSFAIRPDRRRMWDSGRTRRPRSPAWNPAARAPSGRQQAGDRLVGLRGPVQVIFVASYVPVPVGGVHAVAGPDLNETNAALDQSPRQQTSATEIGALSGSSRPYSFFVASDSLLTSVASGADICIRNASS